MFMGAQWNQCVIDAPWDQSKVALLSRYPNFPGQDQALLGTIAY